MDFFTLTKDKIIKVLIITLFILNSSEIFSQQRIRMGIHTDPIFSWFSSNVSEIKNDGVRAGFNFGVSLNKYFSSNYSFSTGINLITAGGRLVSSETTEMEFANFKSTVLPGKPVTYKINYLSVPLGLKLQTNEIGYLTVFTDIGVDPKVVVGGKADIPSLQISGENATGELRLFNLSYHVTVGIEYSLGGSTALVLGLNFDNNFFDITKENGNQIKDRVSHKLLSFRIGVNF